jgi:hypothetical protein
MNRAEMPPPPDPPPPEFSRVTVTVVVAESLRFDWSVTVRRN